LNKYFLSETIAGTVDCNKCKKFTITDKKNSIYQASKYLVVAI